MQTITEEMKVHTEWYEDAKKQPLETLPEFLRHIMEDFGHDYGTVCHALAAGSIATASAMNHHENGGITGFQAGAVMWEFVRNWNHSHNKTGLRLVDYDNFLYPQYESKFQKTMDADTWKSIQDEALRKLAEANTEFGNFIEKKKQYAKDLAAYLIKYPDYFENKKHYDRLGMGTGDEWDAEKIKEESGFEFAPNEPYKPIYKDSPVYQHWESIVNGIIPFGYEIKND